MTFFLLYAQDMQQEGEAISQLLQDNGVVVKTSCTMSLREVEDSINLAKGYIILPSEGMKTGRKNDYLYACLDQAVKQEKPLIPAKFRDGGTGFPFLDTYSSVDFYTNPTCDKREHMAFQVKRLMWGLGIIDHL